MANRLKLKLIQAWDAILWERLLAALWLPLTVCALAAALLVSGVLSDLPEILRFGLLGIAAAASLWSLRPLLQLRLPGEHEALRRVDMATNAPHRAASSAVDHLARELDDPLTGDIWQAHKRRELAGLDRLKAGWPRSPLALLDPFALRLPAVMILLAALFLHSGDPVANVKDAIRLADPAPAVVTSVDAWVTPPAYTGKPPLMLTSPAMIEKLSREKELIVPESAGLTVRAANAKAPRVAFFEVAEGGAELKDVTAVSKTDGATFSAEAKLTRPALVKVFDGETELAAWRIAVLPDAPPTVAFTAEPKPTATGALEIAWAAADDYGVAGITAEISLADEQEEGTGIEGNGLFLFDAPTYPVSLKTAAPKETKGTTANDLTEHPWAGFIVEMKLTVRDAAGRTGESEVKTFKLPEKMFFKPLARALVEQRKSLISDPDDTADVQAMLNALLIYPKGLIDRSGVHIAIRMAASALERSLSQEETLAVAADLWKLALTIEEGDLSDARAELEAIRKELERALREGASPEKIAELMDKMRKAMDKYMQSMTAESQKRMRDQKGNENARRQAGRMISPEDLKKMLDRIEELSKSGANEAAQELLSQLDDILKNMQPGTADMQQQEGPLSDMLDQLSEMMRRQQQLMDDTQRMGEAGEQQDMGEGEEGQEPGMRGNRPAPGDLSAQQEALGRMLREMMEEMGRNGLQPPQSLGEAGKEMGEAADALGKGEKGKALGDQGEAMERLREGAQGMARELAQQRGQGQQGQDGQHGEARGDDRDPLGRPMARKGEDYGPDKDMLPGDMAMRRAREILDMLRSRANDAGRPRMERDYIQRLLRGLY